MTYVRLRLSVTVLALLLGCGSGAGQDISPRGADTPKPVVIPLVRADAEDAAGRLRTLLGPSAKVASDKETNTIFLWTDAERVARAKRLLARLDAPRYDYITRLENADPIPVARVAGTIMAALAFLGNEPAARLVPLERDRAIFFTATDAQAKCVRWLVRQLDRQW